MFAGYQPGHGEKTRENSENWSLTHTFPHLLHSYGSIMIDHTWFLSLTVALCCRQCGENELSTFNGVEWLAKHLG